MIWFVIYAVGVLPAMFLVTYLDARCGGGPSAARTGLVIGFVWPFALLIAPLIFGLQWVARKAETDHQP